MKIFYIFLFALLINNVSLFANTSTMPVEEAACMCDPVSDRAALVTLYNSTDGANWTNTWDLGQPMSTWFGVTLDGEGCVRYLYLNNNELSGSIPSVLGSLSNLTYFHLGNNQLNGNIPVELGNLSNLNNLTLFNNKLSGSIPMELGNLTNLATLYLNNNELIGIIPVELGNLTNLTIFYLSMNQLSGSIPSELGNLSNLDNFNLRDNQLSGSIPSELGNLSSLNNLTLYNNQLSGVIPVALSNLSSLTNLYLYNNQLNGVIPVELGNLSNLRYLFLDNNQLSGVIPVELGNLSDLRYLSLNNNQLSGSIPAELGNLSNLTTLYLNNNQLEGCFPQELDIFCNINYGFTNNSNLPGGGDFDAFCSNGLGSCSCTYQDSLALVALYNSTDGANWTNTWDLAQPMSTWYGVTLNGEGCVTCLDLDGDNDCDNSYSQGNNLVGTIPPELGNLANLTHLSLNRNDLSGSIPVELGNLSNLEYLSLWENQLSGTIPSELGNLSNLTRLFLNRNDLTGSIPSELGNLSNLTGLYLYSNQLSGTIPLELGNLSNLEYLSLYRNQLSGNIPIELGNLSNLIVLNLEINQLTGTIPLILGNLSNLSRLSLNNNRLAGTIPSVLGNLSNLTSLHLSGNQLSGIIPVELGNLSNLQNLYLKNNQLSGNIPIELGNLANLLRFYLNNNQLNGNIPVELANLSNLVILYLNNNQLEGCFPQELDIFCNINYGFTNNSNLPGGGDFDAFCSNGLGSCSCTYQDSLALVALYNSTDGANWTNTWDLAQPISTWYGVTLNAEGCVTNLSLTLNQLSGTIPVELGNLTNIEILFLSYNQLSGTIPVELGNLTGLRHLVLHNNQLSGSIPVELSNITNIEILSLNNNQLSESIPVELGNLANLQDLSLFSNQLSGTIPVELGNLSDLKHVYLQNNQLSGTIPVELGNLANLRILYLQNNQLSGTIPVELGNLTNLIGITLQNNQLEGCFPQELDIFCNINYYNFTNNANLPGNGDFDAFCNNNTGACLTSGDVWPGDVNNDGIVNANDIVLLGVKNDRIGIIRPNATTLWQAESCPDWNDTAPDGIDTKYADCNGDGTVNILSDGLAIQNNYGNTHPNGAFSISNSPTSSLVFRPVIRDETTNGNITTVTIDLELEETQGIANDFYGTAFVLDYAGLGETASIDGSSSFLGAEGTDMTSFAKDFAANRIEGAFTKINGSNNVIAAYETVILGSVLITRMDEIGTLDAGDLGFGSFYTVDNQLNEIELMTTTLPLSLLDFKANPTNNFIVLNWTSANEKDMQSFDIERSENGIDFKKIGTHAALTNASFTKNYSHQDKNVQANITYYYRLKMIEIDNKFDYSNTIVASLKQEENTVQLFPNPATQQCQLILKHPVTTPVDIRIFNAYGQQIRHFLSSKNQIQIELKTWATGVYYIHTIQNQKTTLSRLVKN